MKNIVIDNNKSPNFIGCWNIDNESLCMDIIKFFDENPQMQTKGVTGSGLNESIKKTTDITIHPSNLIDPKYSIFNDYIKCLNNCFINYKDQYPFIKSFLKKVHISSFLIKKYLAGDHFNHIHAERMGIKNLHRVFAWMTYLNDVNEGGTTDFPHYDIKIKPDIGKTLIWPAEWTHAHKGSIVKSGSKYIITGWIHFAN
jgi:prolyl 4-hydroxylase